MGNKQDIGKLFENKLAEGKKIPTESLWEKINTTLNEEKRKRKRIIFYWWLGGGISVLLAILLLFGAEHLSQPNFPTPQENNTSGENNFLNSDKENFKKSTNVTEEDSLKFQYKEEEEEEKLSKIETGKEIETIKNQENSSVNTSENVTRKGSLKEKSMDEIYTVSKKYYYYNSRTGAQIETKNKNEIDSLVSQYKSLDSTATKKKDSINQ